MKTKLLAIFACVLWGSAFVGAKVGFEYMEPMRLSGVRFALAGVLLWPLLWKKHIGFKDMKGHWRFVLIFALLQTFIQYGLFYVGLDMVPAATAAIVIGAGPLFIALMAHFTMENDRLGWRKILAMIIGMSGVVIISLKKGSVASGGQSFYIGFALLIISNLIGSSTNIVVAKYKKALSPILLTSMANFTGGLALYLFSFLVEDTKGVPLTAEFYIVILWLALIPAVGFSIWYSLLQQPGVKVSDLNMWKFIIPVTGCFLSWGFLPNESPDLASVLGILCITAALLLLQVPVDKFKKIRGEN